MNCRQKLFTGNEYSLQKYTKKISDPINQKVNKQNFVFMNKNKTK